MKKLLITAFFAPVFITPGLGEIVDCSGIYIQEFRTVDGQQTDLAKSVTNEFMLAFYSGDLNLYFRLVRNEDNPEMENEINNMETPLAIDYIPHYIKILLRGQHVNEIIFGEIIQSADAQVTLNIAKYDILDNRAHRMEPIIFYESDLYDQDSKLQETFLNLMSYDISYERRLCNTIRNNFTLDGARNYLESFPCGRKISDMEDLIYENCMKSTPEQFLWCDLYLEFFPYPRGKYIEEVQAKADSLKAQPKPPVGYQAKIYYEVTFIFARRTGGAIVTGNGLTNPKYLDMAPGKMKGTVKLKKGAYSITVYELGRKEARCEGKPFTVNEKETIEHPCKG